jgi:hypothetical protein
VKSSSLCGGSCRSLAMVLPALAAAFVTGCFNSLDKSKLSCTTSDYCPHGEVCIGAHGTVPGICGKLMDGGGVDSSSAFDGASAIDSSGVPIDGSPSFDSPSAMDGSGAAPRRIFIVRRRIHHRPSVSTALALPRASRVMLSTKLAAVEPVDWAKIATAANRSRGLSEPQNTPSFARVGVV